MRYLLLSCKPAEAICHLSTSCYAVLLPSLLPVIMYRAYGARSKYFGASFVEVDDSADTTSREYLPWWLSGLPTFVLSLALSCHLIVAHWFLA